MEKWKPGRPSAPPHKSPVPSVWAAAASQSGRAVREVQRHPGWGAGGGTRHGPPPAPREQAADEGQRHPGDHEHRARVHQAPEGHLRGKAALAGPRGGRRLPCTVPVCRSSVPPAAWSLQTARSWALASLASTRGHLPCRHGQPVFRTSCHGCFQDSEMFRASDCRGRPRPRGESGARHRAAPLPLTTDSRTRRGVSRLRQSKPVLSSDIQGCVTASR